MFRLVVTECFFIFFIKLLVRSFLLSFMAKILVLLLLQHIRQNRTKKIKPNTKNTLLHEQILQRESRKPHAPTSQTSLYRERLHNIGLFTPMNLSYATAYKRYIVVVTKLDRLWPKPPGDGPPLLYAIS